ncbi:DUF5615 family PIN-like protein [Candidatus Binatia bacterium]|nr:DUF5615 family PIN-like protein [Candidatus Binatia bacterium]
MKILADVNIAPRTCAFLRSQGHDVVRVGDVLDPTSSDTMIVEFARAEGRVVISHDLDFSSLVALSGQAAPSLLTLRLGSTQVEAVNAALALVLPQLADDIERGVIATFDGSRLRRRFLPIS